MNLFQKYGIKEVADITFYSITSVGDEMIYTPVLFLDTLKISTLEKSAEKVSAEGGKGNKKLISWNFGKEITLNLEDALFTPASMSLIWGGKLESKLSPYTSAIVKANIANKYGSYHYSTKAYPSPSLTEQEWNLVFRAATETKTAVKNKVGDDTQWYVLTPAALSDETKKAYIIENQTLLRKAYFNREWVIDDVSNIALPENVIQQIFAYINELNKLGTIETNNYNVEVVDRMEKVIIRNKEGLLISSKKQKENLLRYYADDKSSSYVIYYDAKTMLPLFHIEDGELQGWDSEDDLTFKLRMGQSCYKWSRTVKYQEDDENGVLGKVLVIDADTFPGDYKIVGETYIREQKTGKDQRYQFTINRAQISTDTSLTLEAEGEPTTFSMSVDVLVPRTGDMIELKQFDVDEDALFGGTRISPKSSEYTYTSTTTETQEQEIADINNSEIF